MNVLASLSQRLSGPRTRSLRTSSMTVGVIALVAMILPLVLPGDKWVRVASLALIYVALASGLNLLVGVTGLLDLGFIGFFVVGAYSAAILTVQFFHEGMQLPLETLWWVLPLSIVCALIFSAIAGVIVGYPTLRARGDYLAIITLAFGEIIRLISINWIDFTGGSVGIRGIPPFAIGDMSFTDPTAVYFIVLLAVGLLLFSISRITASPIGRAWVAIRDDELVAENLGVRTKRYKLLAYVCGACVAGVAGVFFAHMQRFINPDSFSLDNNFIVLSLVIIGGAGTFWGPALGASIWIFFQAWARDLTIVQEHPELRTGILALIVIVLMILRPQGIIGRKLPLVRLRALTAPVTAEPPAIARSASVAEAAESASQPASEPPVLCLDGVTQRFGGLTALQNVSFEVRRGEILGLMGPNGAGKSTLINVISGIYSPSEGALSIGGHAYPATTDGVTAAGVTRTYQSVRVFSGMSVLENLLVGAHLRLRTTPLALLTGSRAARTREHLEIDRARRVLDFVGLTVAHDALASSLAYGEQRRLEIARALMTQPRVLLLDEPAAGMNETETAALGELIQRIRGLGISIILIEHDMDLLMGVSDRIVVLDHGILIATGTPHEIRTDVNVVNAYLGGADE